MGFEKKQKRGRDLILHGHFLFFFFPLSLTLKCLFISCPFIRLIHFSQIHFLFSSRLATIVERKWLFCLWGLQTFTFHYFSIGITCWVTCAWEKWYKERSKQTRICHENSNHWHRKTCRLETEMMTKQFEERERNRKKNNNKKKKTNIRCEWD